MDEKELRTEDLEEISGGFEKPQLHDPDYLHHSPQPSHHSSGNAPDGGIVWMTEDEFKKQQEKQQENPYTYRPSHHSWP